MKRRKSKPHCTDCGAVMERFNPRNVDHVLAMAPADQWQQILRSPDLLALAYIALQAGDALALAAALQLAGMRLRVRRAA
jgi:tyrosyl-tRNA synthetase